MNGVTMPYEEVAGVRMDESTLEFVVEHKPRTTTAQDAPPRQHLRMYTRSDFNLWREALHPKITNPRSSTPPGTPPAGSTPSVVQAAQRWLAYAEQPQL